MHWQWLGRVPYADALAQQATLVAARRANQVPDRLLLLEHPHVITLGASAHPDHVLLDAAERQLLGIEVFETGRGGDATYHGPGQLVGYPILALTGERRDLHRYVRDLEEALIRTLVDYDVPAQRIPGRTGVWVGTEKIAAIGVRVSSGWITSHGFALNVSTDLTFFDAIVPCGIRHAGVTSITRCTGYDVAMYDVAQRVAAHFDDVFGTSSESLSAKTSRKTCCPV
ncbi:MAG: lipoyl(octanoyl) transferase LipB [Longimicrobiales bacterium]